jgi:hypothetical protein
MRLKPEQARMLYLRRYPWRRVKVHALFLAQALGIFLRLMRGIPDAALRRTYRQRLWMVLKRRPEPIILRLYTLKCAMHYHLHIMVWDRRNIGMGVDIDWKAKDAVERKMVPSAS